MTPPAPVDPFDLFRQRVEEGASRQELLRMIQEVMIEVDVRRAEIQAASALMEATAENIDAWFPDDAHPTIQSDLRTVSAALRKRYRLSRFVPDERGGHLEPWSSAEVP